MALKRASDGSCFSFDPSACRDGWIVSCDGVERARLHFFRSASEWRLYGLGPLEGCLCGWEHRGHPPVNIPHSWIRRAAVEQLAAWALGNLASGGVA